MRFAFTAVLAASLCAAASAPAFAAVSRAPQAAKETESDLGKLMGQMGKHFKALKKDVTEAGKKESNAAHFAALAELAEKCKAFPPETAVTQADKKLAIEQLDQTIAAAKAGAAAASAGDVEGAKKAYEDLKKSMKAGHDKFKKED